MSRRLAGADPGEVSADSCFQYEQGYAKVSGRAGSRVSSSERLGNHTELVPTNFMQLSAVPIPSPHHITRGGAQMRREASSGDAPQDLVSRLGIGAIPSRLASVVTGSEKAVLRNSNIRADTE
jgi:hypothetical protein